MSFFKSILESGPAVGVDIGTTSIKIAEIGKTGQQINLVNYAILESYDYLERFNEAFQTSSLKLSDNNTAAYLRLALINSKIKTKDAVAAIPAFAAFSTLLEVPAMSESEIKKFIDFQAKQYVPLPMSAVTLDWMKVGERVDESGGQKYQILLVSIPNEQITKYQNIFKAAGLKLKSLEIEGMSLARSLSIGLKDLALVVDIGSRSTSFSIVQNGSLKFSGQVDFSGGSLTQVIAKDLNITPRRAEDLKRQRGLSGFGGEHELSTLMAPILDVIVYEGKRLMTTYESNYHEQVASVILSGGGANLLGIEDYCKERFNLPVIKANPFTSVTSPSVLKGIVNQTGTQLGVAIGLAIKGLV